MRKTYQICCGVDVHKTFLVATIVKTTNNIPHYEKKRFSTFAKDLRLLKHWLLNNNCFDLCMESTGKYWIPVWNMLEDKINVTIANPKWVSAVKGNKDDTKDSKWIADLFRMGIVPGSYIPCRAIRILREFTRYRYKLVCMRSSEKNRYQNAFTVSNCNLDAIVSDMFGKSSKEMLSSFSIPEEFLAIDVEQLAKQLQETSRGRFGIAKAEEIQDAARQSFGIKVATDALTFELRQLMERLAFSEKQLADLEEQIMKYYDRFPCTLHTITGVGKIMAAVILSEIGDISRFSAPAKLVAFAGIDPSVKQSGQFHGTQSHMSKRGSAYLRRAVWLVAFPASRFDPVFAAFYQKKRSEGKAHGTALGAVARKLLYTIFALLNSGKEYVPQVLAAHS